MAGNTFLWLGGSNTNDAATLANWQVVQNGSTTAAAVLPGTGDAVMLATGGLLNDSAGGLPLTDLSIIFAGSGGTLAVGNLSPPPSGQGGGSLTVAAGTTGTLLTTGTVVDTWQGQVAGNATAGATLDVQVGSGILDLQTALFVQSGGVANIATSTGGTFLNDGGLVAYGGTVTVAAPVDGTGVMVAGGGGVLKVQDIAATSENLAFLDNAGTVALQQTGAVGAPIFGFQAGDAIDLTALTYGTQDAVSVTNGQVTISDGSHTVDLYIPNTGFTAASFQLTADAKGHVVLTTTSAAADWLAGAAGDWSTGTAWSTGIAPGTADNVVIGNLANTFEVTATNEAAHSLLVLAPNGTLALAGSFAVATALIDEVGTVALAPNATVTAKVFAQPINGGALTMAPGAQMTLTGGTTLAGLGPLAMQASNVLMNDSTINAAAGVVVVGGNLGVQEHATLSAANAVVTGQGFAQVQDGGIWSVADTLLLGDTTGLQPTVLLQQGSSLHTGGTLTVGGALQMLGGSTLDVTGGSTANVAGGALLDGGQISLDSTASSVLNIGTTAPGGTGGVVVDAGATLTLAAGAIMAPTVTDNGLILASAGASAGVLQANLAGTGSIDIASGATLTLTNNQLGTVPIDFTGTGSTLVLSDPAAAHATIAIAPPAGSGQTNTIDINTLTYNVGNSISYDAAAGALLLNGGGDGTLHVGSGLSASQFSVVKDANGDTAIVVTAAPCYAAGTRLATPRGEVAVEHLQPGDAVLALDGDAWVARPVRWVGRATVDLARHPDPARAAPIRIRAGAFADGRPHRDLWLSPEHAVFVDGVLMQAQALLNGATVTREYPPRVTYLHVELDAHAVLCAEGLPAESYLDTGNRGAFAGSRGVRALHPDFAAAAAWDQRACAELVLGGPRLDGARARLRARAQALGFALTEEPALMIEAAGVLLQPPAEGGVRLPAGTARLRLLSRSFVPLWLGLDDDRRQLGVAVARLRLGGRALPAAAFGAGWHAAEPGWRWTDGAAALHLPPLPRPALLRITLAPLGARYWVSPERPVAERAA